MKKGTIDLTDCRDYLDLHERIRIGLKLPEWYGANWSAFWDSITGLSPVNDITVKGRSQTDKKLQPHIDKMISLLQENKENCDQNPYWEFNYRVED